MGANGHPQGHNGRISAMLAGASLLAGSFASAPARADEASQSAKAEKEKEIEVVVEGEKSPIGGRDPSAASTILRADRLHVPGQSAADALAQVPGVQVARTGAASDLATASIRGATSAQTPIYLAGVRLNDDITGTADLSLVPLWMLHRVEVYRGNAPADADRLGIGGAIFFEPLLPRETRAGAGLGLGSFGEVSARAAGSVGDERAFAMVALERRSAENDYSYPDDRSATGSRRIRRNAAYTAYDLWSVARYPLRGGSITAIANGFVRDQGVSGLSLSPTSAAHAHTARWLGALSAVVPCASRAIDRCRVEIHSSAIVAQQRYEDPLHELALGATQAKTLGARVSEQARLRYRFTDAFAMGVSVSGQLEQLAIDRRTAQTTRDLRATSGGSAFATFDVTRAISLNGLAALEVHATRGRSAASVLEPTGRLGARFDLGHGITLLANVGRYVRVPTLGELYGISPVVLGNPDLTPERSFSADAGARLSTKVAGNDLSFEIFGFSRFASDLIAYNQDAFKSVRPYNAGSARILGLELTAFAHLFRHLRAELALTVLDPRDTSGTYGSAHTRLPYQARLVAVPYVEVYQGPIRAIALDRAALGARLNHRGSRVADPKGLISLVPETTVDIELALLFWKRRISAGLKLRNLLDRRSADVLGLPLPGRSIHGSMEVWW